LAAWIILTVLDAEDHRQDNQKLHVFSSLLQLFAFHAGAMNKKRFFLLFADELFALLKINSNQRERKRERGKSFPISTN
jgi:hypothetical protein